MRRRCRSHSETPLAVRRRPRSERVGEVVQQALRQLPAHHQQLAVAKREPKLLGHAQHDEDAERERENENQTEHVQGLPPTVTSCEAGLL